MSGAGGGVGGLEPWNRLSHTDVQRTGNRRYRGEFEAGVARVAGEILRRSDIGAEPRRERLVSARFESELYPRRIQLAPCYDRKWWQQPIEYP
ncbi:hypothetical protein B0T44_11090 [Nocardia donostiensis]|uniref:Uncharacterized protein n=1 Tax=Nocardia donostiensis TaxID=1538463 RepID=A0A1V2TC58_9NOCA|nr:hypothetical protein B0T46_19100 [Nocardia donostiensis]OQS15236.1 hypothetical protein B0T36_11395 [Nocardia donostiensis]OQS20078.1 hypothetical protein B0T44_11090 [Nocardia donostiensis]